MSMKAFLISRTLCEGPCIKKGLYYKALIERTLNIPLYTSLINVLIQKYLHKAPLFKENCTKALVGWSLYASSTEDIRC